MVIKLLWDTVNYIYLYKTLTIYEYALDAKASWKELNTYDGWESFGRPFSAAPDSI